MSAIPSPTASAIPPPTASAIEQEPAIASAVITPSADHVTSAGPSGELQETRDPDRSGRRRARSKVPRSKRLDLRVSEEELTALRTLAWERGISIQRMLVDDALTSRSRGRPGGLDGLVIDDLVGELMRLRGEIGRAGNTANQAVRDARRLGPGASQMFRLGDALEAVIDIAKAASEVREAAMVVGQLR